MNEGLQNALNWGMPHYCYKPKAEEFQVTENPVERKVFKGIFEVKTLYKI